MVQELQRTLNDFLRAQPEDARRFSCGATGTARASPRSPGLRRKPGRIRSSLFRTRARLRRRLEEEGVFL